MRSRPAFVSASVLAVALAAIPVVVSFAQTSDAQRTAALAARVLELEEELRRLRGRIETLEADRDRLAARLEELAQAVRATSEGPATATSETGRPPLPAIARGSGPPAPTAPAPSRPPQPPAATGRAPLAGVEEDPAARRGYVLGTIPREAILGGEPSPAPTPPTGAAPRPQGAPPRGGESQTVARAVPGGADPNARFAAARELLRKGDWASAEETLRRFVNDFPNDPNAPLAAYWLGETYLVREDYENAAATFARNYRTFGPEAPRAADNLLKLGEALARLGEKDKACQTFTELERRHPDASSAVRQALARERAAAGCR
ncbi:MAG: tol-pal system protein YbgF [Geminicoccaceae bacterium]|nr:tol-pal system protein YbgF [Geminicoccaceae bacterium]MCS7267020.1 tol-pal system protein YbgF [Geminicoccaceae bacterium]MCX7628753.1 tol-pal system protein YbgF [Geminicoccaceae bacterium]MDW8123359.1 tol-pal system protein YbgF [Geminicoccaceae bacterium]MDW8341569.1 tol-pal system protein YbgF [Geminicoccaceae bacterium]